MLFYFNRKKSDHGTFRWKHTPNLAVEIMQYPTVRTLTNDLSGYKEYWIVPVLYLCHPQHIYFASVSSWLLSEPSLFIADFPQSWHLQYPGISFATEAVSLPRAFLTSLRGPWPCHTVPDFSCSPQLPQSCIPYAFSIASYVTILHIAKIGY